MEFQPVPELAPSAPVSLMDRLSIDVMGIVQMAVVALVTLILGLFVVRPILTRPPSRPTAQLAPPASLTAPDAMPTESSMASLPALDGEIGGLGGFAPLDDLPSFNGVQSSDSGDPAERLRQLIEQKQDETVEVLSQWMNDPSEVAR